MLGTKTDKKNIELIKLVAQLRDHIDIHRIIGLNVDSLQSSDISNAFIGYLQKAAQESLAIYFCKVFESSTRNELNSISGIIDSLPPTTLTLEQRSAFFAFGKKYGNDTEPTEAKSHFKETFGLFCVIHSGTLDRLKEFRDTIGAHSDSKAAIDFLPSHAEFEILYSFAADFYGLVSRFVINAGPAMVPRQAGKGLVKLMESMGVKAPKFDFDADE
jgi:AbiU2